MIQRFALAATIVLVAGCGTTALPPRPLSPARAQAAATADPRTRIQSQLAQLVASRNPHATVTLANDAWQELGRRDGSALRFDVFTEVGLKGQPKERVEFYGHFDQQTGKLVPGTLLVVSETESTFRMLVPDR